MCILQVTWKPREEVYSSDKEDGECSESDEELQLSPRPVIIEAGPKTFGIFLHLFSFRK